MSRSSLPALFLLCASSSRSHWHASRSAIVLGLGVAVGLASSLSAGAQEVFPDNPAPRSVAVPAATIPGEAGLGVPLDSPRGMRESLAVPGTSDSLHAAELNYRAHRLDLALEQFGMVAAMENHAFAWLRIGNIRHRQGDAGLALDAYRRSEAAAASSPRMAGLRQRATRNLALLGLEQTQIAVNGIRDTEVAADDSRWRQEMLTRIDELRAALVPSASTSSPAEGTTLAADAAPRVSSQADRTVPERRR